MIVWYRGRVVWHSIERCLLANQFDGRLFRTEVVLIDKSRFHRRRVSSLEYCIELAVCQICWKIYLDLFTNSVASNWLANNCQQLQRLYIFQDIAYPFFPMAQWRISMHDPTIRVFHFNAITRTSKHFTKSKKWTDRFNATGGKRKPCHLEAKVSLIVLSFLFFTNHVYESSFDFTN